METNVSTPNTSHNGRTMAGVIILIIGGMLLINQLDLFFIPGWLFSWPMWIIAYGLYMGGKYNFKKPIWVIMILIGGAFLIMDNVNNAEQFVWPAGIIAVGTWMVIKHSRNNNSEIKDNHYTQV